MCNLIAVGERRNSHSWQDDWLAKNSDPGWADTFSDSSRTPAPGKQCQITWTQLSRDKWSPASSLCSSTISLLDISSWSTAMIEIFLFLLFGEKALRSHFQKFTEKVWSLKEKGGTWWVFKQPWLLRSLHSGFNKAQSQSTNCTNWNY